jgi:hypothetical protein
MNGQTVLDGPSGLNRFVKEAAGFMGSLVSSIVPEHNGVCYLSFA